MMMAARHSVIRFASLRRDTRTGKHQRAAIHDHHSEEMRGGWMGRLCSTAAPLPKTLPRPPPAHHVSVSADLSFPKATTHDTVPSAVK